jgi:hypothetical protein
VANYKFDNNDQLIDFLFNAKNPGTPDSVFENWETTYISLKTATGLEMSMNTKIVDTGGNTEYMVWKKIKNMIKIFWEQNAPNGINADIRLQCPSNIKNNIDPKNGFSSFRLSLYSGSGVIMVASTAIENATPAPVDPLIAWNNMVGDIFAAWQKEYNKQFL